MARRPRSAEADYDRVIAEVFNRLRRTHGSQASYDFNKDFIEEAMLDLRNAGEVEHIRNLADIKYTYDARREFPTAISSHGYWAIVGTGKSKYRFERIEQNNLIRIPDDLGAYRTDDFEVEDRTPSAVAAVLGNDEQATMTRLRYNEILNVCLGMTTYAVQGHERTSVSCGQIEVDEIYVGEFGQEKFVIPISGKGGKDCLSYTQALNLSVYATEKARFSGYRAIPLGVSRDANGTIFVVRFRPATRLNDIRVEHVSRFTIRRPR